jgi:hypothetical protein
MIATVEGLDAAADTGIILEEYEGDEVVHLPVENGLRLRRLRRGSRRIQASGLRL